MATEARRERQQVVQEVLSQADFNFPKIHLLSHYNTQIRNFGSLPQYSTEVTEALHKPLKDAYRRSNHVNATEQILDMINREHALRIREVNMEAWSRELQVDRQILDLIRAPNDGKRTQGGRWAEENSMDQMNSKYVTQEGKQDSRDAEGTRMGTLVERLMIPELTQHFYEYLRLNMGLAEGSVSLARVAHFPTHHYSKLCVEIPQSQGQGIETHKIWWTAGQPFRKLGKPRADWVWVRRRGRSKDANGELDGRIVGSLEVRFRVRDHVNREHEVTLVSLLSVRGSSKPGEEEGMVRMECGNAGRRLNVAPIADVEGIAQLIAVK